MHITINECNLYVKMEGPEDATPMIALHSPGGSGDSRSIMPIFSPFAEEYRVIYFDLRCTGRSEETGEPSFAQLCEDTEELRRELDLGKIILTGGFGRRIPGPGICNALSRKCRRIDPPRHRSLPHPLRDSA